MKNRIFILLASALALPLMPLAAAFDPLGNDAGSGRDAGDSPAEALLVAAGRIAGRTTPGVDPVDMYAFDVDGSTEYRLVVTQAELAHPSPPRACGDGPSNGAFGNCPGRLFSPSGVQTDAFGPQLLTETGRWTLVVGNLGLVWTPFADETEILTYDFELELTASSTGQG